MRFLQQTLGISFLQQICFAPEGDPPAGDPPAGDPPAGDPPAGDPPAGDPPAAYLPDGLPEHLRGGNDQETIDKLFTEQSSLREKLSANGTVPEDHSKYDFSFGDEKNNHIFDLEQESSQKAIGMFKEVALEHGLTDQQFAAVPKFLEKAVEAGLIEAPREPTDILKSLAPSDFKGNDDERLATGAKRMNDVLNHIDVAKNNKFFDDDVATELKLLAHNEAGVRALELYMTGVTQGAETGGNSSNSDITKDSLAERMKDPKVDRNSNDYDPKLAEQLQADYQKFYGKG